MEYRYYTVEKREDGYRVYGWRELPSTEALKAQDFTRDVVATFPDESQALRAFPHARTILRGKSILMRPIWPEEHAGRDRIWTFAYLSRPRRRAIRTPARQRLAAPLSGGRRGNMPVAAGGLVQEADDFVLEGTTD